MNVAITVDRMSCGKEHFEALDGLRGTAAILIGRLLLRREYLPAAEEAGKKALSLRPSLPLAHELLGELALARNDISQAIADFKAERAVNPLYGGLYERLGDAYFRAGDYQLSLQSLNRAVRASIRSDCCAGEVCRLCV
jgi:tetratricopeptide (TPR) repeat protein